MKQQMKDNRMTGGQGSIFKRWEKQIVTGAQPRDPACILADQIWPPTLWHQKQAKDGKMNSDLYVV